MKHERVVPAGVAGVAERARHSGNVRDVNPDVSPSDHMYDCYAPCDIVRALPCIPGERVLHEVGMQHLSEPARSHSTVTYPKHKLEQ